MARKETKTSESNKTIYLDVQAMKLDYRERHPKGRIPYRFNRLMDMLRGEGADVYSNDGCCTMAIDGADEETVASLAAECGMRKSVLDKYLHVDHTVSDAYDGRRPGDEVHEEDITGDNPEDYLSDEMKPRWRKVGADETEPVVDALDGNPGYPAWDDVDVTSCDPENGCCGACSHEDCLRLVEDIVDNEGISTIEEFEDNLDIYVSELIGIPFEEIDTVDTDTIDCARDMLLDAWCEYTGECRNEGEPTDVSEKRKPCCPGTRPVNERKLAAKNPKDNFRLKGIEKSVQATFAEMSGMDLSTEEINKAFDKLRKENAKLKSIEAADGRTMKVGSVTGYKKAISRLKDKHPEEIEKIEKLDKTLAEKVMTNLNRNIPFLHENVKVNGKSLKDMDMTELKTLYNRVDERMEALMGRLTSSKSVTEREEIRREKDAKKRLFEFIDEEITYRMTREKCIARILNEDEATISDEELASMFGPAQGSDDTAPAETETEKSGEGEETVDLEVDHINVEMVDNDSAEALKASCVEAGIPEDVLEIKPVEKDDDEDGNEGDGNSESEGGNDGEENSEENGNDASGEDGAASGTNESLGYNIRKLLFEEESADDVAVETAEEGDGNDDASGDDGAGDDGNAEEDGNETEEVHVILTLTDVKYVPALMDVLDDEYGITREEFEKMVGGEVVDRKEDDCESATEEDESGDKDKDNGNEDGKKEEGKKEEIDPSELFKGL